MSEASGDAVAAAQTTAAAGGTGADADARGPGAAAATDPSWDVLVVEDDPEVNELVGAYVKIAGFGYRPALDAETALAEARRHPPALITLDLMLPDLDGLEVCRRVKSDPRTRGVPVVILSALGDDKTRKIGLECGAAEYLTKPFDPDRLMDAIARHTGKRGVVG